MVFPSICIWGCIFDRAGSYRAWTLAFSLAGKPRDRAESMEENPVGCSGPDFPGSGSANGAVWNQPGEKFSPLCLTMACCYLYVGG